MLKKIYLFVLLFCLSIRTMSLMAETSLQTVQYWLDNDFSGRTSQTASAETVTLTHLSLPASLSEGFHTVHIRARDNNNTWSVVHSQTIYQLQTYSGSNSVVNYEYWWNNDFANRTSGNTTGGTVIIEQALNAATVPEGLHVFHIRAKDSSGRWSNVHSQTVHKLALFDATVEIADYEYWWGNDFANRVSESVTGNMVVINQPLATPSATEGMYVLHFRTRDTAGRWSGVHSQSFYVNRMAPEGTNKIDAYRFWYDDQLNADDLHVLGEAVNPCELDQKYVLPATFNEGEKHAFHIQFRDLSGQWSAVQTDTFKIVPLFSEEEFAALRAFYTATNGEEWLNTQLADSVWDTNNIASVNGWKGLAIKEGRVAGLELTANNLTGNIPAEIVDGLPHLQTLRVDSNRIETLSAVLPASIHLNIQAQYLEKGMLPISENENAVIPLSTISRYKHSSGSLTENNRFNLNVNDTYRKRITSADGAVTIPWSDLRTLEQDDELTLVQYDGDAIGTTYFFTVQKGSTTQLQLVEKGKIHLYPNPVQDGFRVQGISSPTAKLTLLDLNGRIILSRQVSDNEYVSIAALSGGVYIAQLALETGTVELKIIKK